MDRVALPFYEWRLAGPRPKPGFPLELRHLGDHIRRRRIELGLTRKAAAKSLGTNAWSLKAWEEVPKASIRERFVPTIVRFLGYSPLPAPVSFGELVRQERLLRGWSRPRLAREAGVDVATIRRIEFDFPRLANKCVNAVIRTLDLHKA